MTTRRHQPEGQACPFCAIAAGTDPQARVVYRDQLVTAFFPLEPATRGHTLLIPNRHTADLRELSRQDGHALADATRRIASAIWESLAPAGLNVIQSNGGAATQTVGHLHVHLVPRWFEDRMELRWPEGPAEDEAAQARTLALVRSALPEPAPAVSAEDRRQHLSFIQAVITRMSQASSSAKTWMLPIVTATYGYALTRDAPTTALLGVLAVLVFGLLDANYLKQERSFRGLYDHVASGEPIPNFALNPTLASPAGKKADYWPEWRDLRSWAVAPVYGPLLLTGPAIIVYLHCR